MVLSFLISDFNCKILFSTVFDFNQSNIESFDLQNIVQRVKSEYDFNASVSCSSDLDELDFSGVDFETKGIINVKVNNNYKPVIYQSFCNCLYILLCDLSDNRLLAYRTLAVIIQMFRDFKITSLTAQLVLQANTVSMIVNSLIPSGHMLFLNDQTIQEISKDLHKQLR